MNKIEKNKLALQILSIIFLVSSILILILGISMLVGSLAGEGVKVVPMVFGIIFILFSVPIFILGFYGIFVGISLKATKGSVAQENLGKGTVNATLCQKCGTKLNGEEFCPKCGMSANSKVKCPKCEAENDVGNANCTSCGAELR